MIHSQDTMIAWLVLVMMTGVTKGSSLHDSHVHFMQACSTVNSQTCSSWQQHHQQQQHDQQYCFTPRSSDTSQCVCSVLCRFDDDRKEEVGEGPLSKKQN